jgi:hypothetical protein
LSAEDTRSEVVTSSASRRPEEPADPRGGGSSESAAVLLRAVVPDDETPADCVDDRGDDEPAEGDDGDDTPSSAWAVAHPIPAATADPIPSATAIAPIRPTRHAAPAEAEVFVSSIPVLLDCAAVIRTVTIL